MQDKLHCQPPHTQLAAMATGAALQTQNSELVKCIEELKEKKDTLGKHVKEEELEKQKIQGDLQVRHLLPCEHCGSVIVSCHDPWRQPWRLRPSSPASEAACCAVSKR